MRKKKDYISANFDLNISNQYRGMWGNFRDRRPDL